MDRVNYLQFIRLHLVLFNNNHVNIFQSFWILRIGRHRRNDEFLFVIHSNEKISLVTKITKSLITSHSPVKIRQIFDYIGQLKQEQQSLFIIFFQKQRHVHLRPMKHQPFVNPQQSQSNHRGNLLIRFQAVSPKKFFS